MVLSSSPDAISSTTIIQHLFGVPCDQPHRRCRTIVPGIADGALIANVNRILLLSIKEFVILLYYVLT